MVNTVNQILAYNTRYFIMLSCKVIMHIDLAHHPQYTQKYYRDSYRTINGIVNGQHIDIVSQYGVLYRLTFIHDT